MLGYDDDILVVLGYVQNYLKFCIPPADGCALPDSVAGVPPGELSVVEAVPLLHVPPELERVVEGDCTCAGVAPVEAVAPNPLPEPGVHGSDIST